MASRIPFCLSLLARFRKKLTVMGMMGQMQGMQTASNPPINPMRRIYNKELPAIFSLSLPMARSSSMTGCQRSEEAVDTESETKESAAIESLTTGGSGTTDSSFSSALFSTTGLLPCTFSGASEGGRQAWSLQAPYSI